MSQQELRRAFSEKRELSENLCVNSVSKTVQKPISLKKIKEIKMTIMAIGERLSIVHEGWDKAEEYEEIIFGDSSFR